MVWLIQLKVHPIGDDLNRDIRTDALEYSAIGFGGASNRIKIWEYPAFVSIKEVFLCPE